MCDSSHILLSYHINRNERKRLACKQGCCTSCSALKRDNKRRYEEELTCFSCSRSSGRNKGGVKKALCEADRNEIPEITKEDVLIRSAPRQERHVGKAAERKQGLCSSFRSTKRGHMSVWVEDPGELRECASVWHEIAHPRAFVRVPCGLRFAFASAFDHHVEFVFTKEQQRNNGALKEYRKVKYTYQPLSAECKPPAVAQHHSCP